LGFDPEGMIAQCNDESGVLFELGVGDMLGYSRKEVLPRSINDALDEVAANESATTVVELQQRQYVMQIRPLDPNEPRGTVIAWVPCHCKEC